MRFRLFKIKARSAFNIWIVEALRNAEISQTGLKMRVHGYLEMPYNARMRLTSPPDIDNTIALLEGAGLPTVDITSDLLKHFIGAVSDDTLVGVIGYESYDPVGLLRSLAVAPAARRLGLAARLVSRIENLARSNNIKTFYLLTTDADGYFEQLGYARVSRSELPASIQATAQFSSLCPGSATPMVKAL